MAAGAAIALGCAVVSPSVGAAPSAESAASVFSENCANCHGANGKGVLRGTPDFTSAAWQSSRTDAQLTASITNGKGRLMPAWNGKLTADQIAALVAHVRGLKK